MNEDTKKPDEVIGSDFPKDDARKPSPSRLEPPLSFLFGPGFEDKSRWCMDKGGYDPPLLKSRNEGGYVSIGTITYDPKTGEEDVILHSEKE